MAAIVKVLPEKNVRQIAHREPQSMGFGASPAWCRKW
jgi:hypothetical protein